MTQRVVVEDEYGNLTGPDRNIDQLLAKLTQALSVRPDGSLLTRQAFGDYYDQARQGNIYTLATATSVTIGSTSVYSSTGPATPILGIVNPPGSNMTAYLLFTQHIWLSGTAGASGLVLGMLPNAKVTASGGNAAVNTSSGVAGGSRCKTFVNSALTGQTVAHTIVDFIGGPDTGLLAADVSFFYMKEHKGMFACRPGTSLGMFAVASGTSPIVSASMQWLEVLSG